MSADTAVKYVTEITEEEEKRVSEWINTEEYKEKNFIFLTISVDYEGLPPVKAFIERTRYTFPVLLDPKNDTLDLFAVSRIPTTFIIDKEGRMIGRVLGPRNWKSPEIESILNQLTGK